MGSSSFLRRGKKLCAGVKFCWKIKKIGAINSLFVDTVPVAQLDRVLASDAKGYGFDPRRARHFF